MFFLCVFGFVASSGTLQAVVGSFYEPQDKQFSRHGENKYEPAITLTRFGTLDSDEASV